MEIKYRLPRGGLNFLHLPKLAHVTFAQRYHRVMAERPLVEMTRGLPVPDETLQQVEAR